MTGRGKCERDREELVLDHRQDDGRRTDLQERRHLAEIGITADDVEPTVLLGVRVGLVAGVDDRPFEGGLEADLLLEEVGPLGDLVRHLVDPETGCFTPDLA